MTTPSREAMTLHAQIILEAASLLEEIGASGIELPASRRWPLIDELGGIAAILAARAALQEHGDE